MFNKSLDLTDCLPHHGYLGVRDVGVDHVAVFGIQVSGIAGFASGLSLYRSTFSWPDWLALLDCIVIPAMAIMAEADSIQCFRMLPPK